MSAALNEDERRELVRQALLARKKAYAPYSGYYVGAALLCDDGSIYHGVNVENASSPAGICAERSAFASAVSDGKTGFRAIAVAGGLGTDASPDSPTAYPCGICRQVISELCPDTFEIIAADISGRYSVYTIRELLPLSFRLKTNEKTAQEQTLVR